jgi:hypothetical protein
VVHLGRVHRHGHVSLLGAVPGREIQLPAQLRQGHGKRLHRRGRLLHLRRGRPGHPVLRRDLPRDVPSGLRHAGGA